MPKNFNLLSLVYSLFSYEINVSKCYRNIHVLDCTKKCLVLNESVVGFQESDEREAVTVLKLTDEEVAVYESECLPLPKNGPLSRADEKNLKRVRRKLKNKVYFVCPSVQCFNGVLGVSDSREQSFDTANFFCDFISDSN